VRLLAYAAVLLAAAVAGGCGNGSDEPVWEGPPAPAADGTVAVDGFVRYAGDVEEPWEGSAAMAATEFLRLDKRTVAQTTIAANASAPSEGTGPETVIVTLDGLFDDSVRAERWTLSFAPEGEEYTLTTASRAFRCQPERGHRDFTREPCV
jgi:hypothetical protein